MKQWPEEGPELLLSYEGLGQEHSTVATANGRIYVSRIRDSVQSMGTLFAFDPAGALLWTKEYGRDFTDNFIGTRSIPEVLDEHIYIESDAGAVYCLNASDGKEIWSRDFVQDLGVDSVIQFGYAESPLIDGDHLILLYPVHGFNAPRTVKRFVKSLPPALFGSISLIAVGCAGNWINEAVSADLRKSISKKSYSIVVDEVLAIPLTLIMNFAGKAESPAARLFGLELRASKD